MQELPGYLMLTIKQRIWSSFRTQRESPILKEAICLRFTAAVRMNEMIAAAHVDSSLRSRRSVPAWAGSEDQHEQPMVERSRAPR